MANSKIIFGGEVLIDLTADTVTEDKVLSGVTFHDKKGDTLEGTCSYDSDTSGDTAAVAEILAGKTAHARGRELTGTMPNNGAASGTIQTKNGEYTIAQGYHDGSGKVAISPQEQAKIIESNIREGITILGVTGTTASHIRNLRTVQTESRQTTSVHRYLVSTKIQKCRKKHLIWLNSSQQASMTQNLLRCL